MFSYLTEALMCFFLALAYSGTKAPLKTSSLIFNQLCVATMLIVYAYEKCVLFLHVTKCVTQLCIYIMHLKEYTFFIYIYEISLLFYQLRQVTHFINSAEVASCAQHYLIFCKYVQFSVLLSTNVSLSSAVLDPHVLALDKRKCILERERVG